MSDPTIQTVDAKVSLLVDTVSKLVDTVADLNTVHTEINHLSEKITHLETSIEKTNTKLGIVSDEQISNTIQAEEYKQLKKIIMTFLVIAVLGGGYMTKKAADNTVKQSEAMAEIAKAISSNKAK